jgi:thermostable 8-oxoguanine DNA glycosylase
MAFPDTVTITINAQAKVLTKVKSDDYSSEYRLRTAGVDELRMLIRNTSYKDKSSGRMVDRHAVELTQTLVPVAPSEISTVRKSYLVLENQQLDSIVEPTKFTAGLVAFFTEANITKLINFES